MRNVGATVISIDCSTTVTLACTPAAVPAYSNASSKSSSSEKTQMITKKPSRRFAPRPKRHRKLAPYWSKCWGK